MPTETLPPAKRKQLIFRLAVVLVVAAAVGLFLLKDLNFLDLLGRAIQFIAKIGPWPFFIAMALLPSVGAPTLAFALTAGRAFSDRMSMTEVVLAGTAAMTFNMALSYWLARWALRPWLQRLLTRLGYKLPEVSGADVMDLMIVLRVTPGIPYCVQNYLLGLAEAPVGRYFFVSCLFVWPNNALFLVFGEALLSGKGKMILGSIALLVVVAAAMHFLRRHYGSKRAAAA
jgi:uncharacterized membrane protein YdjX (TVP38/TMEM64 family)